MKKSILLTLITILTISGCTNNKEANTLIVGTNVGYPPFILCDTNGEYIGFDVDVMKAIANKLNKKIIFKNMEFDALTLSLKLNKVDLIIGGIAVTPERKKEISMISYQGKNTTKLELLFWQKIPYEIKSIEDFKQNKKLELCTQAGTTMEAFLNKYDYKCKTMDFIDQLVLDLKHKKSAAMLVDIEAAQGLKNKFPEIKSMYVPLKKDDWLLGNGIGIKKENAKLSQQITKIIAELKKSGELAKLEAKWLKKPSNNKKELND
jgi:arginine transport system substrate-binding protein